MKFARARTCAARCGHARARTARAAEAMGVGRAMRGRRTWLERRAMLSLDSATHRIRNRTTRRSGGRQEGNVRLFHGASPVVVWEGAECDSRAGHGQAPSVHMVLRNVPRPT